MADAKLAIAIVADASQASRELDDTGKKSTTFGDKVKSAGKVAAVALVAVAGAAVSAAKAAADDELAQAKLAQALTNTAGATKDQIAKTEAWITAQGKAFGVTDDELRPALAKLSGATKDVGKAQELAALAMDISAGSGKSLESVAAALAKAQNGSVAGLTKLGIKTKDSAKDTNALARAQIVLKEAQLKSTEAIQKYGAGSKEAKIAADKVAYAQEKVGEANGKVKQTTIDAKEAFGRLNEMYGGQASKAADTTAGKQKILTTKLSEMKETIGTALLPVMGFLVDKLSALAEYFEKHPTLLKILAAAFIGVALALVGVNIGMTILAAATAGVLLPVLAVIAAVVVFVAIFVTLYKQSELFRDIVDKGMALVKDYVKKAATVAKDTFTLAWHVIGAAAKVIWPIIKAVFVAIKDAVVVVIEKAQSLVGWFKSLTVPGFIKTAFEAVRDAIRNVIDWVGSLGRWFAGLGVPGAIKTAFENIKDAVSNAIDWVGSLGRWFAGLSVPNAIKSTFEGIRDVVAQVSTKVESLIGWLGAIKFPSVPKALTAWLNRSMPDGAMVPLGSADGFSTVSRAGPGGFFGGFAPMGGGSGVTVVNVYGALDPEGVARQIGSILGAHAQRNGARGLRVS